jgi:hypothetical protein
MIVLQMGHRFCNTKKRDKRKNSEIRNLLSLQSQHGDFAIKPFGERSLIKLFEFMTQLQIIDFQKRWGLSSHLGGVFSVDLTLERQFNIIINNFVPLLYRELSELTFLQRSHI